MFWVPYYDIKTVGFDAEAYIQTAETKLYRWSHQYILIKFNKNQFYMSFTPPG